MCLRALPAWPEQRSKLLFAGARKYTGTFGSNIFRQLQASGAPFLFSPGFFMTGAVRSNLQQNSFDIRIKDDASDPCTFIYLPISIWLIFGKCRWIYTIHGSYGHVQIFSFFILWNFHPETWDKMNPCQTYLSGKPSDEVPPLNR